MKKYCLAIALVALLALVGCAEHEHSWDKGVETKAATCTEKGEMIYTCAVCKATRVEEIAATGHTLKDSAWTFDTESFTYVQDCEDCKKQQHKEVESGVRVQGVKGFENTLYNSPNEAYDAINEFLGKAENGGLERNPLNEEAFKSIFTEVDTNGDAQVIWTIYGEQKMIEDSEHPYFMTFGREAAHYGNNLHLSRIVIVGGNESSKLLRSTLTIPYEWWRGCTDKANITFKNIAMEGVENEKGQHLVNLSQGNTFGVIMNYEDCDINGFLYCYINNAYELNVKNCNFDSNDGDYSIHVQGSATAPATVSIENCTFSNSRGVNIDQATADATIVDNRFVACGNRTDDENNDYYGSLQITKGSKVVVEGNSFDNCKGNAIWMYSKNNVGSFSGELEIKNNTMTNCTYAFASYGYSEGSYKLVSSGNIIENTDVDHCFARQYDESGNVSGYAEIEAKTKLQ